VSNRVQPDRRARTSLDDMDIDSRDPDGSLRVTGMIDEFRAAQQRRLVKQGIALWIRTEQGMQRPAPPMIGLVQERDGPKADRFPYASELPVEGK
jgi:hypothetical protein